MNHTSFKSKYGITVNQFFDMYVYKDFDKFLKLHNKETILQMAYDLPIVHMKKNEKSRYEELLIFIKKLR